MYKNALTSSVSRTKFNNISPQPESDKTYIILLPDKCCSATEQFALYIKFV
jgi:hypothetical protein